MLLHTLSLHISKESSLIGTSYIFWKMRCEVLSTMAPKGQRFPLIFFLLLAIIFTSRYIFLLTSRNIFFFSLFFLLLVLFFCTFRHCLFYFSIFYFYFRYYFYFTSYLIHFTGNLMNKRYFYMKLMMHTRNPRLKMDEFIKQYFNDGLTYEEISEFLKIGQYGPLVSPDKLPHCPCYA